MNSQESRLFVLLDNYARSQHKCFLAEMFLNKDATEYALCFRPTDVNFDSAARYSCRYLRLKLEDVQTISATGELTPKMKETLDSELRSVDDAAHRK